MFIVIKQRGISELNYAFIISHYIHKYKYHKRLINRKHAHMDPPAYMSVFYFNLICILLPQLLILLLRYLFCYLLCNIFLQELRWSWWQLLCRWCLLQEARNARKFLTNAEKHHKLDIILYAVVASSSSWLSSSSISSNIAIMFLYKVFR